MSELRNQRQVQQQSCEVTTTFCQREAGRVNVGFPPPTRHHLWEKKLLLQLEVYASTLISHKGGWNWRRRRKKTCPVTHRYFWNSRTKFSSTFSFCRFSPRAGRLASGRTCFFRPPHRLWRRAGSGRAVCWKRGEEDRCSVSPAGTSSAQLQRAGKQETEPFTALTSLIN